MQDLKEEYEEGLENGTEQEAAIAFSQGP